MRDSNPSTRNVRLEESQIIDTILRADFKGASDIRQQAMRSVLEVQDYGGVLVFSFHPRTAHPASGSQHEIPVEAIAKDEDGMPIHLLVHVVGGALKEIEVYREDSKAILRLPHCDDLRVISN